MPEHPYGSLRFVCGNRNYSSWSLRAWLCLRKAGLDPTVTVLPMDTPEFAAQIGEHSPTGRVPVLWIGDECIWDSLAIAETVNERYAAGRLWPEDAGLRAMGRSMAAEMHSSFTALRNVLPMNCRAHDRRVAVSSDVLGDIERLASLWRQARDASDSQSGWLFDEFSIADAMFAPVAVRFRGYRLELDEDTRAYVTHWMNDTDLQEWRRLAAQEPWRIDHEEVGEATAGLA
jgi:glutathione S-transferase